MKYKYSFFTNNSHMWCATTTEIKTVQSRNDGELLFFFKRNSLSFGYEGKRRGWATDGANALTFWNNLLTFDTFIFQNKSIFIYIIYCPFFFLKKNTDELGTCFEFRREILYYLCINNIIKNFLNKWKM